MKKVLENRKDIAFRIIIMPLVQIHPKAYDKSKTILCAKTDEASLKLLEDVFAKKDIGAPDCDRKSVDNNISLASKLGISGTPAIIFGDGSMAKGAISAEEIISRVDKL